MWAALALGLGGCMMELGPRQSDGVARPAVGRDTRSVPGEGGRDAALAGSSVNREGRSVTQSLAFPTGERSTSVILLEKVFPAQARLGQPYRYELRVTNLTDHPLSGVVVRERFPASFRAAGEDGTLAPAASPEAPASPETPATPAAPAIPAPADPAAPTSPPPPAELRPPPAAQPDAPAPGTAGASEPESEPVLAAAGVAAAPDPAAPPASDPAPGSVPTPAPTEPSPAPGEPAPAPAVPAAAPAVPAPAPAVNPPPTANAAPAADDAARGHGDDEGRAYAVGDLAPRQTKTIPVNGVADRIGRLDTCTSVTYTPLLCAGTEVINPILTITREAPADADLCEDVVVRYTISNVGTGTETNVRIEEKLPNGLRPAVDSSVDTVVIPVGDLPEGRTRSFSVRLRAQSTGQYTGRAVVRGTGTEAQSQEPTTTTVRAPRLDVKLTGPASEYVGKAAAYDVVVTNTGDSAAREVQLQAATDNASQIAWFAAVRDGEPAPALAAAPVAGARPGEAAPERDAASNQTLGRIEPGQSRKARIAVRPTRGGPLNVSVTARTYCAEPAAARAQTNVLTIPSLLLEMTDGEDPVRVGDATVYRITVVNQGTGPDANVRVVATLPEQMTSLKTDGPTPSTAEGHRLTFAPLPRLDPGQSVTWTVDARATQAADVRFKVEMTSDSLSQPVVETESTKLY